MKAYWKVSMASIAVNAHRHKLISDYQAKKFWMEMSKLGYRKREPNEPPREQPKMLRQMIEFHRKSLEYTDGTCKSAVRHPCRVSIPLPV
jgi:Zn-dependent peptidase ImmA (M78 family)